MGKSLTEEEYKVYSDPDFFLQPVLVYAICRISGVNMYVINVMYNDGNNGVTTQVVGGLSTEEESLTYVNDMKMFHEKVIDKEKELTPVLKSLSDKFRAYARKMMVVEGAERKRRYVAEYYDESTQVTNQWISDNLTEEETEMYRSPWYNDNPEWAYEELKMIVRK